MPFPSGALDSEAIAVIYNYTLVGALVERGSSRVFVSMSTHVFAAVRRLARGTKGAPESSRCPSPDVDNYEGHLHS